MIWRILKEVDVGYCGPSPPQSPTLPRQLPLTSRAPHIHQLPEEVLERIFSLLSTNDIVLHILYVCRRWRDVAEERILSRRLAFSYSSIPTQEALRLIHSNPNIESLEVFLRDDAAAILRAASARCTNLLRLSVREKWSTGTDLGEAVCDVIRSCPRLSDITLIRLPIYFSLRFYRELGTALPDLRKLHFHECRAFQSPQLQALLDGCPQMNELRILGCRCSDENITMLAHRWGMSLEVLELNALKLSDSTLAPLAGCLRLRRLKLMFFEGSGEGLQHLTGLPHLEELDLVSCERVLPESWCRFISRSRSSPRLRKLSFLRCDYVDDVVLTLLASACPSLEELNVSLTSVTATGIWWVLRSCRRLRRLNLENTVSSVAEVVRELPQLAPQLRWIRISALTKSSLGAATLRGVRAQMPLLKIGWDTVDVF